MTGVDLEDEDRKFMRYLEENGWRGDVGEDADSESSSVDELEKAAEEVERRVREAHPEVRHVLLDPTDDPDEVD